MTWHGAKTMRGPLHAALTLAVLATLWGCDDGGTAKTLKVTAPTSGQELTRADDSQDAQPGLQFSVEVSSTGLDLGTPIELFVSDVKIAESEVTTGGNVTFLHATLPPGNKTLYARTADEAVSSNEEHGYVYKALVINSPSAGTVSDADPATAGVQVNVVVETFATAGDVTLVVDDVQGETATPDASGLASFTVTLETGSHTLGAMAEGSVTADPVSVTVAGGDDCPSASLRAPAAPAGGGAIVLGGDDCIDNDPFTTTVVLNVTDAADGTTAYLFVNGASAGAEDVAAGLVTFDNVALENRDSLNTLRVEFDQDGLCGTDLTDIDVDCAGPDCMIASPDPVIYTDPDTNEVTEYINASMLQSDRLPVGVATSASAIGQTVRLVIDDVETLVVDATADGDAAIADFLLSLTDGSHTLEASCTDSTGNVTTSATRTWVVDRDACEVSITSPSAGHRYVPADDLDPNDASVTVLVEADVTGPAGGATDDCNAQRAAACDPVAGIDGVDFGAWTAGQTYEAIVDENNLDQTLCVEVTDRAGNVGRGTVDIQYEAVAPVVAITSPADGTLYNRLGNSHMGQDYVATNNDQNPRCTTDFAVDCSNVGLDVELWRVNGGGDELVASAPCVDPGEATFTDVEFQASVTSTSDTLYATQTIVGNDSNLVGSSSSIALGGDCRAPAYDLLGACTNGMDQLRVDELGNYELWVRLSSESVASRPDSITFDLTSQGGNGIADVVASPVQQVDNFDYRIQPVDLGGVVDVIEVRVNTPDSFGNAPTMEVAGLNYCEITIASEIPVLTSATTDLVAWTPNDNNVHGCAVPGQNAGYEVPVDVVVDQLNDRTLEYQIDNGGFNALPLSNLSSTVCVPVPDDGSIHDITIRLNSTSGGTDETTISGIDIQSIQITDPADASVFTVGDGCGSPNAGELDISVSVLADEYHGTSNVVLAAGGNMAMAALGGGANSTATGCLIVPDGNQTISATVEGTGADAFVDVSVSSLAPQSALAGLTATVPDVADPNYRDGMIAFEWDTPVDTLDRVEILCAPVALDPMDEATFLAAATAYAITPADAGGGREGGEVQMRIGEIRHCVAVGYDFADRASPLPAASVEALYQLRAKEITTEGNRFGTSVSMAGDVDGDGADDFLIGARFEAHVYYGAPDGNLVDAVGTTFTGDSNTFGRQPRSVGDVNGDNVRDLLIPEYGAGGATEGVVYVVFGTADTRFSSTTLRVTQGASDPEDTCTGADICYLNETATDRQGFTPGVVGDFDGDGVHDLSFGSPLATQAGASAGRAYVLRGGPAICASPPCVIHLPSDDPSGFYLDGDQAGRNVAGALQGMGDMDGDGKADLVLAARGMNAVAAEVRYLEGRDFGAGLASITWTNLQLIDSGGANAFGTVLAAVTNIVDNGETDVPDLVVGESSLKNVFIYPGDLKGGQRFKAASRVRLTGAAGYGSGLAITHDPIFGPVDDMDGDGIQELLARRGTSTDPEATVVFGNVLRDNTTCSDMQEMEGNCSVANTHILPLLSEPGTDPPTAAQGTVQPVGDVNNDGYVDYAVAHGRHNADAGRVLILY